MIVYRFTGLFITLLPSNNTVKLPTAHAHITADIGMAVPLFNILTKAVEIAPIPNCIAPINAEAVPAFFEKGANEKLKNWEMQNPAYSEKPRLKIWLNTIREYENCFLKPKKSLQDTDKIKQPL